LRQRLAVLRQLPALLVDHAGGRLRHELLVRELLSARSISATRPARFFSTARSRLAASNASDGSTCTRRRDRTVASTSPSPRPPSTHSKRASRAMCSRRPS
jgi:hypothetical protein